MPTVDARVFLQRAVYAHAILNNEASIEELTEALERYIKEKNFDVS